MKQSSGHYYYKYLPRFKKSAEILIFRWSTKDTIVQWPRLKPNMKWFPHPLSSYKWYLTLTTFIWCGWAHVSLSLCHYHNMRLLRYGKSSKVSFHRWPTNNTIEALSHHGIVSTSPLNIRNVFDNLHMIWIGIVLVHHQTITTIFDGPDLGSLLKSCFPAGLQRTPLCSDWGSNPTWNGFHIPSQHI